MKTSLQQNEVIKFIRERDYRFINELGSGACGVTVLLHDDQINEDFVCKKFTPYSEEERPELFENFTREIKILHQVLHANVVRVFNYYLYPKTYTGFILMEFVDGPDIEEYLTEFPERVNEIFLQTISGFRYLESKNILHRDIRPGNIIVRNDGTPKIIDFGFGKRVANSKDFGKSVSLNWAFEPPPEFSHQVYDFTTEVYFVGKLFERIIKENEIDQFKYEALLRNMCEHEKDARIQSFANVETEIQSNMFFEIQFEESEIGDYRYFAQGLQKQITKIHSKARYQEDVDRVQITLENVYRTFMLEETVPDCSCVINCLLNGGYYYRKTGLSVVGVRDFLHLLKSSSAEKKRIILSNLQTRLNAIMRYDDEREEDDQLPF